MLRGEHQNFKATYLSQFWLNHVRRNSRTFLENFFRPQWCFSHSCSTRHHKKFHNSKCCSEHFFFCKADLNFNSKKLKLERRLKHWINHSCLLCAAWWKKVVGWIYFLHKKGGFLLSQDTLVAFHMHKREAMWRFRSLLFSSRCSARVNKCRALAGSCWPKGTRIQQGK